MDNRAEIVELFSKYCSQCDGQCCKRGVFSVFEHEHRNLSEKYKELYHARVKEQRGKAHDVCINELCAFSSGHGCTLPIKTRPSDCLTYPFYPSLNYINITFKNLEFVIDENCPFHSEIAQDKILVHAVRKYWKNVLQNSTREEIVDWLGSDETWSEWYNNAKKVTD